MVDVLLAVRKFIRSKVIQVGARWRHVFDSALQSLLASPDHGACHRSE